MKLTTVLLIAVVAMLIPVTINAIIQLQLTYELAKGVSELEQLELESESMAQEQRDVLAECKERFPQGGTPYFDCLDNS